MSGNQYRAVATGAISPAATSSAATLTVKKATPTVTVTPSDVDPLFGVPVTFNATLAGGASPSGTVTFMDGATTLGTGAISGTTATFTTSTLAAGPHSITAVCGRDINNAAESWLGKFEQLG